jgi:hypothetical protein
LKLRAIVLRLRLLNLVIGGLVDQLVFAQPGQLEVPPPLLLLTLSVVARKVAVLAKAL